MRTIKFQVDCPGDPGHISPFIQLADPTEDINNLRDAEEVVINEGSIRVFVDYPLAKEFVFEVRLPFGGAPHFTRASLAHAISALYQRIYNEEDQTSEDIAGPIPGMFNRCWTQGTYGIWGFDLKDLVLSSVHREYGGKYNLEVDSR